MHLFITVIKRKKNKTTIVSKALHTYTCFLGDHQKNMGEGRKIREILAKISQMKKGFIWSVKISKFFIKNFTMDLVLYKGMLISTLFRIINLMSASISFISEILHVRKFSIFLIWWPCSMPTWESKRILSPCSHWSREPG